MLASDLGLIEYDSCFALQRRIADLKISGAWSDVLLTARHDPTITFGTRGGACDLLVSEARLAELGVRTRVSDRGGRATYHGPGQLVVYPVVTLRALGVSVRSYVEGLEDTILRTLDALGVKAFRAKGKVGVWVSPDEKIASIGARVRRGVAYHGFSLNVDMDMDPSALVICCGAPDARMVSVNQILARPVEMARVRELAVESFAQVFSVSLTPVSAPELFRALGQSAAAEAIESDPSAI